MSSVAEATIAIAIGMPEVNTAVRGVVSDVEEKWKNKNPTSIESTVAWVSILGCLYSYTPAHLPGLKYPKKCLCPVRNESSAYHLPGHDTFVCGRGQSLHSRTRGLYPVGCTKQLTAQRVDS